MFRFMIHYFRAQFQMTHLLNHTKRHLVAKYDIDSGENLVRHGNGAEDSYLSDLALVPFVLRR